MKMSDEPYTIIHLGNPYDFVIKNINEHETYGTFQGDKESMEEFIEKVNSIIKENDELKSENQRVSEQKHIYKQDWKHLCIDKELLDSENEKLKSRVDDLKELNKIYVNFIVNEGYELADVMGKCDVE